jgi:SRSO17 transposase
VGSRLSAPGPQEKRFAAYIEGLAKAAGHADRKVPLKNYCTGLLLPGERKSVEPMAARLAPDNVQRMHQSLHHLVADAPWSDPAIIEQVRSYVLSAMKSKGPVQAWIVDHCCPANDLRPADKPFFLRELHGNPACRDLNGNWS